MPPERHLRPGRINGFWIAYLGLVGLIASALIVVLAVPSASWLAGAIAVVVIGGVLGLRRSTVNANEENQRAVNLLNAGEVEDAGEIFDRLARRRRLSLGHIVFVYNRAVAYLLEGRHQRALSIFNAIEKSGRMSGRRFLHLQPNLLLEMGCCLALSGELEQAESYLRRAAEKLQPPEDGRLLFLEAVIGVRRGRYDATVARIQEQWKRAEGALRGPTIRTLRMLHAYALAKAGRASEPAFTTAVAGAQPSEPADFHWATKNWPEFAAFVEAQLRG
jgi:tetratricopeptide (TPR) repeat protein